MANFLLDDLNKEVGKRGFRFARYVDDYNIFIRSKRAGKRVMESITESSSTSLL
nr:hypothetical protein [Paenibacillus elgii]